MKHILLALCYSLICFLTLSQSPIIEWQKSLGGTSFDESYSVVQTTDGGYIVAGDSWSNNGDVSGNHGGSKDYWIVKLDVNGVIEWQKSLGGTGWDEARSVQQTLDGGYIIAGSSESVDGDVSGNHGTADYWVVKLDASGNISWQKSLGGSGPDIANALELTIDGGSIVAGYSRSIDGDVLGNHGDFDYWIVKLDASGNIAWQKSLGGTGEEKAKSIQQTIDGGYVVAGYSLSNDGDVTGNHGGPDYWIVKLNATGDISWQKSFGGSYSDYANSIVQTTEGGYIVAGSSTSQDGDVIANTGIADYWIVKLDINGSIEWQKNIGGTNTDEANSIKQKSDGGFIVAGISWSSDVNLTNNFGASDFWLVSLDANGNITWQKNMGGLNPEEASSIEQTSDGGFIVAGKSWSNDIDVSGNHGETDYWVVKLSSISGISTHTFDLSKCVVKITDLLGREVPYEKNKVLIYVYSDGTTQRVFEFE